MKPRESKQKKRRERKRVCNVLMPTELYPVGLFVEDFRLAMSWKQDHSVDPNIPEHTIS